VQTSRCALSRWSALTRCRDDGRIEIDNYEAERSLRSVALGRKNPLFAGSDDGGERAVAIYSLLSTGQLNGLNTEAYLHHFFERLPSIRSPGSRNCCPGPSSTNYPISSSPPEQRCRRCHT
jgi:hypothetical protein